MGETRVTITTDRSAASMPAGPLVLGVDAGGTTTRALVAGLDGVAYGRGTARGGNPTTGGLDHAARSMADAIRTALAMADTDPATIGQAVVGVAGGARFHDPEVHALFAGSWTALGLRCPVEVVGDIVVAFATGTSAPNGHVLVSGTGAIAAELVDHTLARMAGGLGWLLGDEGSAFWIGREATRLTVAAYDGQRPMTPLARAVAADLLGGVDAATAPTARAGVVAAVYDQPPPALASLAPLVSRLGDEGDGEAGQILLAAADELVATLARLRPATAASPIVLSGSCITGSSLLRAGLTERLARIWAAPVGHVGDGAAGAAWLAANRWAAANPSDVPAFGADLHRRLTTTC
jgi:glucosamine kinase